MQTAALSLLEPTLSLTASWLSEIAARTDGRDDLSLAVLRAVLHALRDRLPEDEAVALAQELPALIRGIWFEDWRPLQARVEDVTFEDWLVTLEGHLLAADADDVPARDAAEAVLAVLGPRLGHEMRRRLGAAP